MLITTIGELDTNGSEIMDQEAIPEENMSGMNNQDNTEDSQNTNIRQHVFSPVLLPRLKSTVQYKPKDETSWKTVTILGRGGKATGKYKNFLNVMDTQTKEQDCIDWKNDVEEWIPIDSEVVLITGSKLYDLDVEQAKVNELNKWKQHNVYEEVENQGQSAISTRWVCTEKETENGKLIKARLVARGFEEDSSCIQKDSPTCNKESLRVALAILASKHWHLNSLDIQAAFLQGSEISRKVYLKPPVEASTNKLWKLRKMCVWAHRHLSFMVYSSERRTC